MSDEKQKHDHTEANTGVAASSRKPYEPPAIEEEALIENVAMGASSSMGAC